MVGFTVGRKIIVTNYKAEEVSERFNGRKGKIIENKFGSSFIRVLLDDDNMECLFTESEIELVTENPQPSFVKVVPEQLIPARREIVKSQIILKEFAAGVDFSPAKKGVIINCTSQQFSIADVRELITHLTTIADILEENAK